MATRLPAAQKRLFKNIFVCKRCSQKIRADSIKVIQKQVACRRCRGRVFRPIKSKKK